MTALDPRFGALLAHLHRGGAHGHFWTLADKRSYWWNGDGPPAKLPSARDVYFGVHPATESRGAHGRSTDETIAAVNCLPADFDAKRFTGGKAEALAHVEALTPPPSVVIDSGGGYHCYWLLHEPWHLTSAEDRARAKALQERWAAHVGGDPAAAKLPQLLRVPGTLNGKYHPAPRVAFVRCDLSVGYDLGELAAYALPPPRPPAPAAPGAAPSDRRAAYGQKALADELARVALARSGTRASQGQWREEAPDEVIPGGSLLPWWNTYGSGTSSWRQIRRASRSAISR